MAGDVIGSGPLVSLPVLTAFFLPLFHELLILTQFMPIFGSLLLLNGHNERFLLFILTLSVIKKRLFGDLEFDEVIILELLLLGSDVFTANCGSLDGASKVIGLVKVGIETLLHCACLKASHCLSFERIRRRALSFLNGKFKLIEKSQGGAALLLHNIVSHLAVEAYFEHA